MANAFPTGVGLGRPDIHIICLATPSEKVKPFFFRTGGPAENFWHLLTKDNLNHEDFIAATKSALLNREGTKAAAEAAERASSQLRPNQAQVQEEGGRMRDRLCKELPSQLCDIIFVCCCIVLLHAARRAMAAVVGFFT